MIRFAISVDTGVRICVNTVAISYKLKLNTETAEEQEEFFWSIQQLAQQQNYSNETIVSLRTELPFGVTSN